MQYPVHEICIHFVQPVWLRAMTGMLGWPESPNLKASLQAGGRGNRNGNFTTGFLFGNIDLDG